MRSSSGLFFLHFRLLGALPATTAFGSVMLPDRRFVSQLKSSSGNNDDNKVAGSFFNPVPPSGDASEDKNDTGSRDIIEDNFEKSLQEMINRRKTKPRAATPSTIGGVPTSKASGFGKGKATTRAKPNKKQRYVEIGPRDKKLNDINNPEYDDQGYTLYANEETGEKSRVFDALVSYPCEFKVKIVGANEGAFASEMVQLVADSCRVNVEQVKWKERKNGKWTSVTVSAPVQNAEMLYELYENVDRDPRVKFKF